MQDLKRNPPRASRRRGHRRRQFGPPLAKAAPQRQDHRRIQRLSAELRQGGVKTVEVVVRMRRRQRNAQARRAVGHGRRTDRRYPQASRIEFGGYQRFKEECREAAGGTLVESLFQDLRFGVRMLRKSHGFTIVAVATLAMAIGANAVVFGVMDALILRPLNVPQADSLYGTEYGVDTGFQSYPNYVDLRDRNRSFDGLAAFTFAFV